MLKTPANRAAHRNWPENVDTAPRRGCFARIINHSADRPIPMETRTKICSALNASDKRAASRRATPGIFKARRLAIIKIRMSASAGNAAEPPQLKVRGLEIPLANENGIGTGGPPSMIQFRYSALARVDPVVTDEPMIWIAGEILEIHSGGSRISNQRVPIPKAIRSDPPSASFWLESVRRSQSQEHKMVKESTNARLKSQELHGKNPPTRTILAANRSRA